MAFGLTFFLVFLGGAVFFFDFTATCFSLSA
jgi:hypothetical protein